MNIREFLNNNSAAATIIAVVLLIVSLGIIVLNSGGPSGGSIEMYYYDLNAKTLMVESSSALPPIQTDSGDFNGVGAGVKAIIYSCSDACGSVKAGMSIDELRAAGADIAYLERYTAEAKALLERQLAGETLDPATEEQVLMNDVTEVSDITGERWMSMDSDAGLGMMQDLAEKCSGGTISYCMP